MATDISLLNNVVQITVDGGQPRAFVQSNGSYFFNTAGNILSLNLGGTQTYSIPIADLRIAGSGTAPANAAAAYTALSSVFQK